MMDRILMKENELYIDERLIYSGSINGNKLQSILEQHGYDDEIFELKEE